MYTIYVNDCPLILASSAEAPEHDFTLRYVGKPKFFLQITGTLEGGAHPAGCVVLCDDVEQAWRDFRKHYAWVEAAGGVVRNGDKVLCIYRRDHWDLPKGKIDEGESPSAAALREVEEETGVSDLVLGEALPTTYHTYYTGKKKRVLKPTYWYSMSSQQHELVPEEEEDIEVARWVGADELPGIIEQMYVSLREVVRMG